MCYLEFDMEPVNVFRKPEAQHEQFLAAAVAAIQRTYPNEQNRYLIHFRFQKLGLLVDYYTMDGRFYSRPMGVIGDYARPQTDRSDTETDS